MFNDKNIENVMVSELKISREEAKIYMILLQRGKMPKAKIASYTTLDMIATEKAITGLIDKGACIEIDDEIEALNPRFAITNMYKMMCHTENLQLKRNNTVDQLATILEKPYQDVRTK